MLLNFSKLFILKRRPSSKKVSPLERLKNIEIADQVLKPHFSTLENTWRKSSKRCRRRAASLRRVSQNYIWRLFSLSISSYFSLLKKEIDGPSIVRCIAQDKIIITENDSRFSALAL